jgi:hypothetical protein
MGTLLWRQTDGKLTVQHKIYKNEEQTVSRMNSTLQTSALDN